MSAAPAIRMRLSLSRIAIIDRLRPVDEDWVAVLSASMADRGQNVPIVVRPMPPVKGVDHALVAGLHRLTVAQRLGWDEIDVDIRQLDDDAARLAEIDENLMRRELSALDRGVFMRERKLVWERLYPEVAKPGPRPLSELSQPLRRFTEEAAERTGFSERSVQLAVTIGRLPPQIRDAVRGTPVENSTTKLVQLVAERPEDQLAIAQALASGQAKTIAAARVHLGFEQAKPAPERDPDAAYTKLMQLWIATDPASQQRFLRVLRKNGELR